MKSPGPVGFSATCIRHESPKANEGETLGDKGNNKVFSLVAWGPHLGSCE